MIRRRLFVSLTLLTSIVNAKIIKIESESDYKKHITDSKKPLLVKFAAGWCSVCNGIEKPFEDISNENEFNTITFAQVDIDKLDNVSKKNGIVGVPTFVYRDGGEKKVEEIGVQNMSEFKDHLRSNLRKNLANSPKEAVDVETLKIQPMQDGIEIDTVEVETSTTAEKPGIFTQIIQAITTFIVMILAKIKGFFTTIIDALKGFFRG